MDDRIAFLNARYDEEEQAAQHVLSLESDEFAWEYHWAMHGRYRGRVTRQSFQPGAPTPRRVLAEAEAKRQMLDAILALKPSRYRVASASRAGTWKAGPIGPDPRDLLLPLLVLPYADHPEFREEWRPLT
jgi:hypothetical protein